MCHLDDTWSQEQRETLKTHLFVIVRAKWNQFLTFGVVCVDRKTEVTFAFALLHGCWALMFQALVGQLASVCQTLH